MKHIIMEEIKGRALEGGQVQNVFAPPPLIPGQAGALAKGPGRGVRGCFSLGASRRNVPLAGPHPSYTRAHYKGSYKGTLQRSISKISLGFPA